MDVDRTWRERLVHEVEDMAKLRYVCDFRNADASPMFFIMRWSLSAPITAFTASTAELRCPSRVFSASQLAFLTGRYIYGYRVRMCIMRLTRKSTMKMKKQILATSAAAKATNPNPRAPATNAIRRKTSV
jgi:hypothetical protein